MNHIRWNVGRVLVAYDQVRKLYVGISCTKETSNEVMRWCGNVRQTHAAKEQFKLMKKFCVYDRGQEKTSSCVCNDIGVVCAKSLQAHSEN